MVGKEKEKKQDNNNGQRI